MSALCANAVVVVTVVVVVLISRPGGWACSRARAQPDLAAANEDAKAWRVLGAPWPAPGRCSIRPRRATCRDPIHVMDRSMSSVKQI